MTRSNLFFTLIVLIVISACSTPDEWTSTKVNKDSNEVLISFGSCAHSYDTLKIFDAINEEKSDLWIWLGDIMYGDSHDMSVLKAKYDKQKNKPQYQKLLANTEVIGIWDDHDYGINDGGRFYSKREESKELLLDFLDVADNDPVRSHDGAYTDYDIQLKDKLVKVILLDSRYFRDTIYADTMTTARYLPNPEGDILGEAQWTWLEDKLSAENVDFFILGTGIQLIAEEQVYEKWANFPKARNRMFDLLKKVNSSPVMFISGDRHIAEISRIELEGVDYPVYDFTASGLTHTWGVPQPEPNKHRVDSLVIAKNYGLLNLNWDSGKPSVTMEIKGENGELLLRNKIDF
jgi:alkaline phosphatase D